MTRLFDGKTVVLSQLEGFAGRFGLNLVAAVASAALRANIVETLLVA
jgi:hypothetical protein